MHLTNYAINKHNENFVQDGTMGSKRYCLVQVPQCPVHILQESCIWDTGLLPSSLGHPWYHRSALYHLLSSTQETVHPECLDDGEQLQHNETLGRY